MNNKTIFLEENSTFSLKHLKALKRHFKQSEIHITKGMNRSISQIDVMDLKDVVPDFIKTLNSAKKNTWRLSGEFKLISKPYYRFIPKTIGRKRRV